VPPAGQVEIQVPHWKDIIQISFHAWMSLGRRVFQSAWIACGYATWDDMPKDVSENPISVQDARQVLDVFGKLGGGSPQRCTCFEWQIKDPWLLSPKF